MLTSGERSGDPERLFKSFSREMEASPVAQEKSRFRVLKRKGGRLAIGHSEFVKQDFYLVQQVKERSSQAGEQRATADFYQLSVKTGICYEF
jgi:hypothetical protein